ncbi:hypothetical protein CVD28_06570 [Bacillus sp. M6-12]|nr:hypothetical protein CVD28_06570 [Bacillus sp. M6-12]
MLFFAMLKFILDSGTMLIAAKGSRILNNFFFLTAVVKFSVPGRSGSRETPQEYNAGGFRTVRGKPVPFAAINRQV